MLEFITPIVHTILKSLVMFGSAILEGLYDMVDNWKSILFVISVALASGFIGHTYLTQSSSCKETIRQLHKDYTFIPKKKSSTQQEWWRIFN